MSSHAVPDARTGSARVRPHHVALAIGLFFAAFTLASGVVPLLTGWDEVPEIGRHAFGGIPGGLKNAIDWVSRLQNQPFAGKPVALQSASPGPVGGARVQYDLRKAMMFLDAFTLNKPEIFIGHFASKFDEKTGELKDETTRGLLKQQLAAFATFIARVESKD